MSKKRRAKKAVQAVVVDEFLAEGSGPHAIPDEEGVVAVRVSTEPLDDGDLVVTAEAAPESAPEPTDRKAKGKGRKGKQAEAMDSEDLQAASDGDVSTTEQDVEPALEASAESPEDETASTDAEGLRADAEPVSTDVRGMLAADAVEGEVTAGERAIEVAADGDHLEEIDDGDISDGEAAVLPTSAATMDAPQLKLLVEALVFASDKPLTVQRLRQLTRVSDVTRLEQALAELATDYEHRGLILHQVSGGYQFRTRPQYSIWVQQLIAGRPVRLSRAQLETLAIVAYRQPITRPEIDDIRGVDSSATLKLLLDRALIRALGKREEVGRPTLYGTTKEFLDFFSLGDLRELPTLREYSELSEESRKVMSQRLGIDPDGGGEGGSTPPADSGPMGGGPMDGGTPEGAAMAGAPTDDGDELGGATVQGARLDTETDVDSELGGQTVQSFDGEGLGGETVQSMDGEGLDDATTGGNAVDQLMDDDAFGGNTVDGVPPGDDVETASAMDSDELGDNLDNDLDSSLDGADPMVAAEMLAAVDVDTSSVEPTE